MKWIAGFILMILVMVQSFTQWIIIGQYAINKDYIAQNLCINRERPKLHCNGKCQLMKKLAEEENQNAPAESSQGKLKFLTILFSQETKSPGITGIEEMTSGMHSRYLCSRGILLPHSIFHPPGA